MKLKLSDFFTVRKVLTLLLLLSIVYAWYSMYYKIKYWGFTVSPKQVTDVWTIDAKVSFDAVGEDVDVILTVPSSNDSFKILSEEIVAKGYKVIDDNENNRISFKGKNKSGKQNLYYRLSIYDDVQNSRLSKQIPTKVERPILSEEENLQMSKIWELAELQEGDKVQKIISTVNQEMASPTMSLVLPSVLCRFWHISAFLRELCAQLSWRKEKRLKSRGLCWKHI